MKAQIYLSPGDLTVIITLSLLQLKKFVYIEVGKKTVFVREDEYCPNQNNLLLIKK